MIFLAVSLCSLLPSENKVLGLYLVAQSCRLFETSWTVAHQAPLSMGILQARILEWVAMLSSRVSSQPRDYTQVSPLQVNSLPSEPPGKPMNNGVGNLSLFQGIFLSQKLNFGLLTSSQLGLYYRNLTKTGVQLFLNHCPTVRLLPPYLPRPKGIK